MDAGLSCRDCRQQYKDSGQPAPCEVEDGILPDGTCQFGMPELTPRNMAALRIFGDIQAFGWEGMAAMNDFPVDPFTVAALRGRLRVIDDEIESLKRKRAEREAQSG